MIQRVGSRRAVVPGRATSLASYEQGVEAYLTASSPTPHPAYEEFLQGVVSLLPMGSRMLELGLGRETMPCSSKHTVCAFNGPTALGPSSSGHQAEVLDVVTDQFGGPFDVVFANAVLLHLTVDQFDTVLAKAAQAVRPGGLMVFTVKEGDGAQWTTTKLDRPRYFAYWREPAIRAHLSTAGWTLMSVEHVQGRLEPWLYLICKLLPQEIVV